MTTVKRLASTARTAFLTATALWLAVVGTGVSMVHSHDDESPHRHLILFGVECPAELPADGDAHGDAVAASARDSSEPTGAELVESFGLTHWGVASTAFLVPHDSPSAPRGLSPSPHATRSAILRA